MWGNGADITEAYEQNDFWLWCQLSWDMCLIASSQPLSGEPTAELRLSPIWFQLAGISNARCPRPFWLALALFGPVRAVAGRLRLALRLAVSVLSMPHQRVDPTESEQYVGGPLSYCPVSAAWPRRRTRRLSTVIGGCETPASGDALQIVRRSYRNHPNLGRIVRSSTWRRCAIPSKGSSGARW